MKKMIIYMPKLSVVGMEKALINMLNFSDLTKNYNIELYLGYVTEKEYLKLIPNSVNVKICCKGKWNITSKAITYFKMQFKKLVVKNKYDVSICYAYQHPILASLTRKSSKNNIVFIHNNLKKARSKKQIDVMEFEKFSKVVCVSKDACSSFMELFPNYQGKIEVINNYLDGYNIIEKSKEEVDFPYQKPVFISVARHEEKSKKISRIINSAEKLTAEGYKFTVLLIGEGEDHQRYKEMIKSNNIIMLGTQINPYKYEVKSDALVLSSEYEGYGIVIDEARILNIPVISTEVADAKEILQSGYGIICENSEDGVYNGMKEFLNNGYKITNKFDYKKFNDIITSKLNDFIEVYDNE